jgi:hypothetical protein
MEARIYRYSPEKTQALVQLGLRRAFYWSIVMALAVVGVVLLTGDVRGNLVPLLTAAIFLIGLRWALLRRTRKTMQKALTGTEIELTDEALLARTSMVNMAAARVEVTELRSTPEGLLVKGRSRAATILVRKELDGYEELRSAIDSWAPSTAKRAEGKQNQAKWTLLATLAAAGVFVVAVSANEPSVAVPFCVIGSLILIACIVYTWMRPGVKKKLKLQILLALVPAISLLARAYELSRR